MATTNFGILRVWHTNRGFGVIQNPATAAERFYLHISKIQQGPEPKVGDRVDFNVAPSLKEGGLPQAIDVVVTAIAEAL